MIWRDVANFQNYDAVEKALADIKGRRGKEKVAFSVSRAFRKFGARPPKPKD